VMFKVKLDGVLVSSGLPRSLVHLSIALSTHLPIPSSLCSRPLSWPARVGHDGYSLKSQTVLNT
jgi:hypothetical protein